MKCKAHSTRTGEPCRKDAILGATVCRYHGGGAPQVKRAAARRLAMQDITADRTLLELARIAFSDDRQFWDRDGNLIAPHLLDDDQAAMLAGLEIIKKNAEAGDGQTDLVHKVKKWDKTKALEILAKHFGLMTDKIEHSGDIAFRWQESEAPQDTTTPSGGLPDNSAT